jgi:hypothetical protein
MLVLVDSSQILQKKSSVAPHQAHSLFSAAVPHLTVARELTHYIQFELIGGLVVVAC